MPGGDEEGQGGLAQEGQQQAQRHTGDQQQPQAPAHPLPHPFRLPCPLILGHKDGQGVGAAVAEGQEQVFDARGRGKGGDGGGSHGVDGALDQQLAAVEAGLLEGRHRAVLNRLTEQMALEHQVLSGQPQLGVMPEQVAAAEQCRQGLGGHGGRRRPRHTQA